MFIVYRAGGLYYQIKFVIVIVIVNIVYIEKTEISMVTHHKGKKLPSIHVLGDFNFKDINWPDRLSKSGSTLSQSEE